MKRSDVKNIIQQLAKEEFIANPNAYPFKDGIITQDSIENIMQWSINMWDCRNDEEIARDFRLGLNVDFYILWTVEQYKKLLKDK